MTSPIIDNHFDVAPNISTNITYLDTYALDKENSSGSIIYLSEEYFNSVKVLPKLSITKLKDRHKRITVGRNREDCFFLLNDFSRSGYLDSNSEKQLQEFIESSQKYFTSYRDLETGFELNGWCNIYNKLLSFKFTKKPINTLSTVKIKPGIDSAPFLIYESMNAQVISDSGVLFGSEEIRLFNGVEGKNAFSSTRSKLRRFIFWPNHGYRFAIKIKKLVDIIDPNLSAKNGIFPVKTVASNIPLKSYNLPAKYSCIIDYDLLYIQ